MKLYKLNKIIFKLTNNVEPFLNGLTSNTLDKPHNAFLNIHGKIIATFDQIKKGEDEYFILIEQLFVDATLEHLKRYLMLSRTQMEPLEMNVYFDLEKKDFVFSDEVLEETVSDDEYTLFRLQNKIPVQGIDYHNEFLLNVSETMHVSFTKGCFLGQEPISKVHNRSKPTWKLIVKYADECSEEERQKMTSVVLDSSTHRKMGFVFVKNV